MKTLEKFKSRTTSRETAYGIRSWHTALVFNDSMWVIAGRGNRNHNDVWVSRDGRTWEMVAEEAPFRPRCNLATTVFKDKMWVAGGRSDFSIDKQGLNDVWFSKNGQDWKAANMNANFTKRFGHTLTPFQGKLWIIGGLKESGSWITDRIVSSNDGEYWLPVKGTPSFGHRAYHTTLVHDDKLWVIGGVGSSILGPNKTGNAEVWYSDNGYDWFLATENPGFLPRFGHTAVTDGDYIYVMGGSNSNENHHHLNDIWRSHNGVNWENITVTSPPCNRFGHTSLYFKNGIWAFDGAQFTYDEQTDCASIVAMESISNSWFMNL